MDYDIDTADNLKINNNELTNLLTTVYVDGGYTSADEAMTLFEPSAVRNRGFIIAARENRHASLAGMIIVVPPYSLALRLAKNNEAELHLLGVIPEHRHNGIGKFLVEAALEKTKNIGCTKVILWTQTSMISAQKLYESCGFIHINNFNRNDRDFKLYELPIITD